jgi:hypothetical protein
LIALLLMALLLMALSQLPFRILNRAIESFHGGRIDDVGYQPACPAIRLCAFFPAVVLIDCSRNPHLDTDPARGSAPGP